MPDDRALLIHEADPSRAREADDCGDTDTDDAGFEKISDGFVDALVLTALKCEADSIVVIAICRADFD